MTSQKKKFMSKNNKLKIRLLIISVLIALPVIAISKIAIFGFSDPSLNLIYSAYNTISDEKNKMLIEAKFEKVPFALKILEDTGVVVALDGDLSKINALIDLQHKDEIFSSIFVSTNEDSLELNFMNDSELSYLFPLDNKKIKLPYYNELSLISFEQVSLLKYFKPILDGLKHMIEETSTGYSLSVKVNEIEKLITSIIDTARTDEKLKNYLYASKANLDPTDEGYQQLLTDLTSVISNLFNQMSDTLIVDNKIDFIVMNNKIEKIELCIDKNRVIVPISITTINRPVTIPTAARTIDTHKINDLAKKEYYKLEIYEIIDEIVSVESLTKNIESSMVYSMYRRFNNINGAEEFLKTLFNSQLIGIR